MLNTYPKEVVGRAEYNRPAYIEATSQQSHRDVHTAHVNLFILCIIVPLQSFLSRNAPHAVKKEAGKRKTRNACTSLFTRNTSFLLHNINTNHRPGVYHLKHVQSDARSVTLPLHARHTTFFSSSGCRFISLLKEKSLRSMVRVLPSTISSDTATPAAGDCWIPWPLNPLTNIRLEITG